MAAIAKENGEVDDALVSMQHYVEESGHTPVTYYELAALNAQLGRLEDAVSLMKKVPAGIPSRQEHHYIRGTLAANQGNFSEALDHLRCAVEASPASGQAWLALAMIGPLSDADKAALFAAAPQVDRAPTIDKAAYAYACGKALDELQEHHKAFASFSSGAAMMHRERPYEHALDCEDAANAMSGWKDYLAQHREDQKRTGSIAPPIFITGLPRSGTTLVEQILASHSMVAGGGELGLMHIVGRDVGKSAGDYQRYLDRGGSAMELAALYDHLARQRYPGVKRVIDKSLDSSRHIGMITAIFPDAPIIWLRRDTLDCAWSSYRTWFLRGLNWSWSLEDIGKHFLLEDKLMKHWVNLNPRILTVDYADLVTSPETWIERISNHCDLPLEPALLNSHETKRNVMTASVAQVRKPINTHAVGSSKPYRDMLQPFLDSY